MHTVHKSDVTAVEVPPPRMEEGGSLRARKHQLVRREIEDAAWKLFVSIGFDKATIDLISRDAGVSRRTFFRYFQSKEDLLSISICDFGDRIAQAFAEKPRTMDAFRAMAESMIGVICEEMKDEHQPRQRLRLIFEDPSLRGRFLWGMSQWVPALSLELVRRRVYRGDRVRCDLAAALYCTAFDQAHSQWFRSPGRDLEWQVRRAFRQLRALHSCSEETGHAKLSARRSVGGRSIAAVPRPLTG